MVTFIFQLKGKEEGWWRVQKVKGNILYKMQQEIADYIYATTEDTAPNIPQIWQDINYTLTTHS